MKKAMVCLIILVASAALGWLAYKQFDSSTAGYVIAVIGMAAAIAPIFVSEPKNDIRIETKGDNSPIVRGNFVINQKIVNQQTEVKRKEWRSLDSVSFPLLSDSDKSRSGFWENLSLTLLEMYQQHPYTEFTILLNCAQVSREGQDVLVYEVVSYQPGFGPNAQRKYASLLKAIVAWKNAGATAEGRAALEQTIRQEETLRQGWTTLIEVTVSPAWTPIQCVCDSTSKRLTLRSNTDYTIDPSKYPDHLANTKELMLFIGSYFNMQVASGGDIGWAVNNYPLMKLMIAVLDHDLDMSKVRINVQDCNEWDYIDGECDEGIRIFERKSSGMEKA